MLVLAHRGCWNSKIPGNSLQALSAALEKGFGFESDIRDYLGNLVISHNIADGSSPRVNEVFQLLKEYQDQYCFAVNIKADGLKEDLLKLLQFYKICNYFTFDMSVPQMIEYREAGLNYFTRQSEFEVNPVLYQDAKGVWIDAFIEDDWITKDLLKRHIDAEKKVCLVSPDLHKNAYHEFWSRLKSFQISSNELMLCTDHPEECREFFSDVTN